MFWAKEVWFVFWHCYKTVFPDASAHWSIVIRNVSTVKVLAAAQAKNISISVKNIK